MGSQTNLSGGLLVLVDLLGVSLLVADLLVVSLLAVAGILFPCGGGPKDAALLCLKNLRLRTNNRPARQEGRR